MSRWWDEDKQLCLITKEEFHKLPDGTILECIDGTISVKGVDFIDEDIRFNHMAYGVTGDHPLRVSLMLDDLIESKQNIN